MRTHAPVDFAQTAAAALPIVLLAGVMMLPNVGSPAPAAEPQPKLSSPTAAEYGHGLSAAEARDGWVSLFDGRTAFGWSGATARDGLLVGAGTTTTTWADCEINVDVQTAGRLTFGDRTVDVPAGPFQQTIRGAARGLVRLGPGLAVRALAVRPLKLAPLFDGKDLAASGWAAIRREGAADDRQTRWAAEDGAIHATGGPGALEYRGRRFGDLVLQLEVRTRSPLANGGVFFRSQPGAFLNGYEAQVYNACAGGDPAKPAVHSTGAIDDRQSARRVVSRDGEPFTMTVVAAGPHIATWVNGYQLTDWTDQRPTHDNPRQGLRVEPGTIQFQAHDPDTDLEFRNIRAAALE